jgi:hypothetical protein
MSHNNLTNSIFDVVKLVIKYMNEFINVIDVIGILASELINIIYLLMFLLR